MATGQRAVGPGGQAGQAERLATQITHQLFAIHAVPRSYRLQKSSP